MKRMALAPLLVGFLFVACEEDAPPPAPAAPLEVAAPNPPLRSTSDLAEVLPSLKRDGSYSWLEKRTRVPGHFAAWLHSTEPDRRLFSITVDDLRDQPERLAFYQAMPTTVGKYKGRVMSPDWIQALVAGRYEVILRADHEDFRSQAKLAHWFDKMRWSKLEEPESPSRR